MSTETTTLETSEAIRIAAFRAVLRSFLRTSEHLAREHGLTYGQFISGLKAAGITLDRKSLSELAISSPAAFGRLAAQVKAGAKASARV